MKRACLFLSLFAFAASPLAHSAEDQKSPKQGSEQAGSGDKFGAELARRLAKVKERTEDGRIPPDVFLKIARQLLKDFGIPEEKVDKASAEDLLQMVREQSNLTVEGLQFLGGQPISEKDSAALNEQFERLLKGHRPGAALASQSTVALRNAGDKAVLALGAAVRPGWILTKATEAKKAKDLRVDLPNEVAKPATIVRVWDNYDLALVKVDDANLKPIVWSPTDLPPLGSFISACGPLGMDPVALGVVSVAPRSLITKNKGFLGIGLEVVDKGLSINSLQPDGAADKGGLRLGDVIQLLNGKKFDTVMDFALAVSSLTTGDTVALSLLRDNKPLELKVKLGQLPRMPEQAHKSNKPHPVDRFAWMNSLGSLLSDRRTDFPSVFQTDFPLNANECGGPVTDLDGNVLGLVIARAGRVDTFVIPSQVILKLLSSVDWDHPERVPREAQEPERKLEEKNIERDLAADLNHTLELLEKTREEQKQKLDKIESHLQDLKKMLESMGPKP